MKKLLPKLGEKTKHSMHKKAPNTAMGVALSLLAAGLIVQITDRLELFGHHSFIPLIIGFIVICLGVLCVLFLRWNARVK